MTKAIINVTDSLAAFELIISDADQTSATDYVGWFRSLVVNDGFRRANLNIGEDNRLFADIIPKIIDIAYSIGDEKMSWKIKAWIDMDNTEINYDIFVPEVFSRVICLQERVVKLHNAKGE